MEGNELSVREGKGETRTVGCVIEGKSDGVGNRESRRVDGTSVCTVELSPLSDAIVDDGVSNNGVESSCCPKSLLMLEERGKKNGGGRDEGVVVGLVDIVT